MMRRVPVFLILLGSLTCGEASPVLGSDLADVRFRAGPFGAAADSLRKAAHIPGLAVVVLRDGHTILSQGFGYADLDSKRPVNPDTPFNIASVTKPISAVVAMKLVEQGILDLDRPMQT